MEPRPQQTQSIPGFDPQVDPILCPETCESALPGRCPKAASHHPLYVPFNELDRQHLPAEWRHQDTLQRIRDIGQRVVKLRVRELSPDRPVDDPRLRGYGHQGTGFVTYDGDQGVPVVNTNRHVVYDSYEASRTEVVFFYEGDSEGIQCAGSCHGFRCPIGAMDYSVFTMQQPLPEAVITWQNYPMSSCQSDNQGWTKEAAARKTDTLYNTCSWSDVADLNDNVVIISHPHGSRKQVSMGTLSGNHDLIFAHNVPTCAGSSGAPLLTLGRMDERPLLGRLNGFDTAALTAGRIIHQGAYPSAQGTIRGVGAPRVPVTVSYEEVKDFMAGRMLLTLSESLYRFQQTEMKEEGPGFIDIVWCIRHLVAFLGVVGFLNVVGPPWTLAAFLFILLKTTCIVLAYGAVHLPRAVVSALSLSLDSAAMHGVTQLACVLVLPGDRGWLWTALLALLHFLIYLVIDSNPVQNLLDVAFLKQPRAVIQIEDWLMTCTEKLFHKHWRFWLRVADRIEQGHFDQSNRTFCDVLRLYGLFCALGPPWTLRAFVSFLVVSIFLVVQHGARGLRRAVFFALARSVPLAAMHGVTQLAYALVPPGDRGWLWTILLTLAYCLIHLVTDSNPVRNLLEVALPKQLGAVLQVAEWLGKWSYTLLHKLWRFWLYVLDRGEEGSFARRILTLYGVFCLYGWVCGAGPPWTLALSVVSFLYITIYRVTQHGASGLRDLVLYLLSVSLHYAAMHGVTQLADVLVSPDDRGWVLTALLGLSLCGACGACTRHTWLGENPVTCALFVHDIFSILLLVIDITQHLELPSWISAI